ncbi:MAG: epoxyqueuosine reductase QueH, partial [Bacilli bacterium]|nr:epoxyqueuosine reductase QueH [Bacilli bacterium]
DPKEFFDTVRGYEHLKEGSERCFHCYRLRLTETAKLAKKEGFDYFGTTLSISPYKNSQVLNEIGKELEEEYDIPYLYADFKKKNGYKRSIELSKLYGLYRQDYCGCIYSKKEREESLKKIEISNR